MPQPDHIIHICLILRARAIRVLLHSYAKHMNCWIAYVPFEFIFCRWHFVWQTHKYHKNCNNFVLSFLLDFPLAGFSLKRWNGKWIHFSSPMSHQCCLRRLRRHYRHDSYVSFICGLSFSLTELITFCAQSLFSYLKFCLAFRYASLGRSPVEPCLIVTSFTYTNPSFRRVIVRAAETHFAITNSFWKASRFTHPKALFCPIPK